MATMLKCAADNLRCRLISSRGLSHHAAISAPLGRMMDCTTGLQFVLPESNNESQENPKIELPNPYFSGSMELMAVPKRKVSRHKRGIRNGPKALKPVPVIIRCKSCGRVKLPHFYCCSGDRGGSGEGN